MSSYDWNVYLFLFLKKHPTYGRTTVCPLVYRRKASWLLQGFGNLLLLYIPAMGRVIYQPFLDLHLVFCLPQHTYRSLCQFTQTLGFSCYTVWGKHLTSFPQRLAYCFEPRQAVPSFSTGFKWFFYEGWGYQNSQKPKMLWDRKLLQCWQAAGLAPWLHMTSHSQNTGVNIT